MKILLKKNSGFEWRELGPYTFKGTFKYNNLVYNSNEKENGLTVELLDQIVNNVAEISGSFIFLFKSNNELTIYTDIVRSFTLYYTYLTNELLITDSSSTFLEENIVLKEVNENLLEFKLAGFVTGRKTIFDDIFSLEAGTITVLSDSDKDESRSIEYNDYKYCPTKGLGSNDVKEVYENVFNDLLAFAKGKTIVVPLSGGYDSRIIVEQLHRLHASDVICYTYGVPGNTEARISKEVAEHYNFKWIFIEYNEVKWKSSTVKKYIEDTFDFVSLPHIQDFIAVNELKSRNLVPDDSIFIPGHSGDFIAGSHLHKRLINCNNQKSYKLELLWKHFDLNFIIGIHDFLSNLPVNGYNDVDFSYANKFEKWGLKERQAKFIVNSMRVYEYMGYSWNLPLWDIRLVDFWLKVPIEQRINRKLYFEYVGPTDPWFRKEKKENKNKVSSLSEMKYYLKWIHRSIFNFKELFSDSFNPMGWYALYDKKEQFRTFGLFKSINSLVVNNIIRKNRNL